VAAVSVGVVGGAALLDLSYEEDSEADVDCNVVMTSSYGFVELQGTGERGAFPRKELDEMLCLAETGLERIFSAQKDALGLSASEAGLFEALAAKRGQ
jgi:ribonuclease PH